MSTIESHAVYFLLSIFVPAGKGSVNFTELIDIYIGFAYWGEAESKKKQQYLTIYDQRSNVTRFFSSWI